MHLQTRSITASQCISKLDRSWPPSAFLSSLHPGLQVHLQSSSITASKFIVLARSQLSSASLSSLDLSLQVHLQTQSITASQCISDFTQSRSPIASPNPLAYGLGGYLLAHSIDIFRRNSNRSHAPPAASPDILGADG